MFCVLVVQWVNIAAKNLAILKEILYKVNDHYLETKILESAMLNLWYTSLYAIILIPVTEKESINSLLHDKIDNMHL